MDLTQPALGLLFVIPVTYFLMRGPPRPGRERRGEGGEVPASEGPLEGLGDAGLRIEREANRARGHVTHWVVPPAPARNPRQPRVLRGMAWTTSRMRRLSASRRPFSTSSTPARHTPQGSPASSPSEAVSGQSVAAPPARGLTTEEHRVFPSRPPCCSWAPGFSGWPAGGTCASCSSRPISRIRGILSRATGMIPAPVVFLFLAVTGLLR